MIELNLLDIASRTNGVLVGDVSMERFNAQDLRVDSRLCKPGSIYIAKPGEEADGHDFVDAAFKAGAVLAITERPVHTSEGVPYPSLVVPDAVRAMADIASAVLERARATEGGLSVIGITGSAGKTTTKDLLAKILRSVGQTVAPQGSYNGEIGVPLTVFDVDESTKYLVVEMGATHIGHIAYLASMVQPDVGVELMVGSAHAGEFGGTENIARAKAELVQALKPSGTAVLNLADSKVREMAQATTASVLWFGEEGVEPPVLEAPTVRAVDIHTTADAHPALTLKFPSGEEHAILSGLIGVHHVNNILAAAAAAFAVGIDPETIARELDRAGAASRWRMERTDRSDGVTVINDAYNANPESMRAALRTLVELGYDDHRRTWAVLGPMYELGEDSIREHNALGQSVVRLNISRLIVVGKDARPLHIGAINEGSWGDESVFVDTVDQAFELLQNELEAGDIVLFKSSRDAGLRHLGDRVAHAEFDVNRAGRGSLDAMPESTEGQGA